MNIRRLLGALRLTTSGCSWQRPSMTPSGSFPGLQVIRGDYTEKIHLKYIFDNMYLNKE
jgi:hypothetical protein